MNNEPNPYESPNYQQPPTATPGPKTTSRAITVALVQQAVVLILAALMLDGGRILQACAIAALVSWIGTLLIILLRPKPPTNLDLAIVKFSYWPALLLVIVIRYVMRSL